MKKFLIILLSLVLSVSMFAFAACSDTPADDDPQTGNEQTGDGRGTDTLREAKGIYFPLAVKSETVVIGFSCKKSKMSVTDRMIFSQIEKVLKAVL